MYLLTKNRGDKENGPVRYLELYPGLLVHDHFSTYQKLTVCQHVECNAHIDRYLRNGIDFDHSEECKELLELLYEMLHRKEIGYSIVEAKNICDWNKDKTLLDY